MIRTLLIIAGAALVLAIATLAGASAIGGRDMARNGWAWTFRDTDGGDSIRVERDDGTRAAQATRTLAWTGGEALTLDLSADVDYVQGDQAGVVVTGPADLIDRVRLVGDRLTWVEPEGPHQERIVFGRHAGGRGIWIHDDTVKIVVTAPSVKRFDMRGSSDLSINGYAQPTLTIESSGSGDVWASGSTTTLDVDATGSGDFDLGDLTTTDAKVALSGSGDARIAPTGAADVDLSGSGDVSLATRPATLRQSVTGSGSVSQD